MQAEMLAICGVVSIALICRNIETMWVYYEEGVLQGKLKILQSLISLAQGDEECNKMK
jgi:hypothetical protein